MLTNFDLLEYHPFASIVLDLDGKISIEDISGIIERYINTFFFKRENKSDKLEVNLYPSESIDEEKFKMIVKDIKAALKSKNLTELGLFNKLSYLLTLE